MIALVEILFSKWNNNKIVYCHWKGNNHLEDAMTEKSDFDILISDKTFERGCELMEEIGLVHVQTQYGARFPGIQDWLGLDNSTGTMIHVHLHQKMIAGHSGIMEYILPWNELAFAGRQKDSETGIYLINPNLEMILLYTRLGIEQSTKKMKKVKGGWELKEKTKNEIAYLKEHSSQSQIELYAKTLYPDAYKELMEFISLDNMNGQDITHLFCFMKKTCKKWMRYSSLKVLWLSIYKTIEHRVRRKIYEGKQRGFYKKGLGTGKGLTIAFIGQDGAGKTTVTQQLLKWLSWKLDVRYVYLGSGDNYFSWKKSLIHRMSGKGPLRYIRAFLSLTDILDVSKKAYRNIKKAEKYAGRGGLVVYDRFPQMDYPGICDGPKIRVRLKKLFGNNAFSKLFLPLAKTEEKYIKKITAHHPNVVIKLVLPPEESIRRKPQERLESVTRKHEIVKSLKFEHSDVYTLDATMPFEEEIVLIKNIIWQHIQK